MKTPRLFHILALAGFLISALAKADGPALINYQGRVVVGNVNFNSPPNGLFKFALVNANGTTTYWSNDGTSTNGSEPTNAVSLLVTNGLYSVLLGDTSLGVNMHVIPPTVFAQTDLRLRVWFNDGPHGSQRLSPDQRLAPNAYVATGSITATDLAAATAPSSGQVLGFNGNSLNWTAPGAGDGIWTKSGSNAYYSGGNVGIGTTTPLTPLQVKTVTGADGLSQTDGTRNIGTYVGGSQSGADGGWLGTFSDHPLHFFVNSGQPQMSVVSGGVGIGTFTPTGKLHLYDAANSVTETIETGGGTGNTTRLALKNGDGEWDIGTNRGDAGDPLYFSRQLTQYFSVANNGNGYFYGKLGVGTPATQNLTVAGFNAAEAMIESFNERAILSLSSNISGNNRVWTLESGLSGTAGLFGVYDRTAGKARLTIDSAGTVTVTAVTITGGSDVAEPFPIADKIDKGSVVVIDADHPGRLKRSAKAYDRKVAGIVSGANGINPGIALHQEGALDGGENVALSGRVYVQAESSSGFIEPGDLLTTSDIPGCAMKATDAVRRQGSILGKAMSSLRDSRGTVLVLVTLQ
jgi:hypothetical protein